MIFKGVDKLVYNPPLNVSFVKLDITLQGRGAKFSLHSRVQQQNKLLYNVRPTSPTSVPQTLPWTSFTGLKYHSFWASLQGKSFEKSSQKRFRTGSQNGSLNMPVLKANACFWRFLFHFFLEPSKSIIQTAEARQHASTPQNLSTKINYFPDGRTDARTEHLLILHSRT